MRDSGKIYVVALYGPCYQAVAVDGVGRAIWNSVDAYPIWPMKKLLKKYGGGDGSTRYFVAARRIEWKHRHGSGVFRPIQVDTLR